MFWHLCNLKHILTFNPASSLTCVLTCALTLVPVLSSDIKSGKWFWHFFWHVLWHMFWPVFGHLFWHLVGHLHSDTCSNMYSDIYSYICYAWPVKSSATPATWEPCEVQCDTEARLERPAVEEPVVKCVYSCLLSLSLCNWKCCDVYIYTKHKKKELQGYSRASSCKFTKPNHDQNIL